MERINPIFKRLEHALGLPLIERGLGPQRVRNTWIGAGLAAVLVVLNLGHWAWLGTQPRWRLSWGEREFLDLGLQAVVGSLELQLLIALGAAMLILAPTLACQTVIKEAETRTMDVLTTTLLSPLALHNGFALGALARILPFVAPLLLVHLLLPLSGEVDLSTTLWTTGLLLVGAWSMGSMGAMCGLLLKSVVRGQLAGLVIFALFAAALCLPLISLFESGSEHFAYLSVPAAGLHSLVTDGNVWLRQLSFESYGAGPEATYESHWMGLRFAVEPLALAIALFFGALSTHIGRRRLSNPLAPAMSFGVAAASLAFVGLAAMPLVAHELDTVLSYHFSPEFQSSGLILDGQYHGRQALVGLALLALCALPFYLLFAMGTGSSRDAIRRFWANRAAGRADLAGPPPVSGAKLASLGLIPLACGVLLLAGADRFSFEGAGFGLHLVALLPYLWTVAFIVTLTTLWLMSARKGWQTLLTLVVGAGAMMTGFAYTIITVDNHGIRLSDYAWSNGTDGIIMGVSLMFALLALPVILAAVNQGRRQHFLLELHDLIVGCTPEIGVAALGARWPRAAETEALRIPLRAALPPMVSIFEGLATATPGWLELHGSSLRRLDTSAVEIDLERPFGLTCTRSPSTAEAATFTTLQLTLSQGGARIDLALRVDAESVNPDLPVKVAHAPALPAGDVEPLLATLRLHAEAQGLELPRIWV